MYQHAEAKVMRFFRRVFSNALFRSSIHFLAAFLMPLITISPNSTLNIWNKVLAIISQSQVLVLLGVYTVFQILFHLATRSTVRIEKSHLIVCRIEQEYAAIITCMEEKIRENSYSDRLAISFDSVAQMVCNSLHLILNKHDESTSFRVRIVKQYLRESKKYYYCISGYKSENNNTGSTKEQLVSACKQHTKDVLERSSREYDILIGDEVLKVLVFEKIKQKKNQVRAYVAIPVFVDEERPRFIIEVDSSNKKTFGRNTEDIKSFMNVVIWPFTRLLDLMYTLENTYSAKESGH